MTGRILAHIEPCEDGVLVRVTIANAQKLNTLNSPLIACFIAEMDALAA